MPALSPATTDYLAAIKAGLQTGSDLNPPTGNIFAPGQNYLAAMDMATVLELLQEALSNPIATGVVTFTGVPTADDTVTIGGVVYTWVAVPAVPFDIDIGGDADDCVTNLVAAIVAGAGEGTLYGTGTTANPDVTAADGTGSTVDISAQNSGVVGNAVVFTESMDNATISGSGTLAGGSDGILLTASNPGTVRTFQDGVAATGVVTFTGVPTADDTLTIGTTVYTWVAAPAVPFDIDIGADAPGCVTNLVAAIVAGAGEGTVYGTGTTAHPDVVAADGAGDTVDLTVINTGVAGNAIVFTESMDNATISGAGTLAGGLDIFTADAHAGDTFTFDAATTTAALQGLSFKVASNTVGVLTFAEDLPAATVVGDDGLLTSTSASAQILALRDGSTARGSAPRGNVYGASRSVTAALLTLAENLAVTVADFQPTVNGGTMGTSTTTAVALDIRGTTVPVDFFVSMLLRRAAETDRKIVSSDENGVCTVTPAYGTAATGAYTVVRPLDGLAPGLQQKDTHPGAQAGGNARLADFIDVVEAGVVAFTLPV